MRQIKTVQKPGGLSKWIGQVNKGHKRSTARAQSRDGKVRRGRLETGAGTRAYRALCPLQRELRYLLRENII